MMVNTLCASDDIEAENGEYYCNINEYEKDSMQIKLCRFAFDKISLAVCFIDISGRFNMVNEEACKLFGYSRAELYLMNVSDIDSSWKRLNATQKSGDQSNKGSIIFESFIKSKAGRVFPVEISVDCFIYENENYTCLTVRDVSYLRREGKIKKLVTVVAQISQELVSLVANLDDTGAEPCLSEVGFSKRQIEIVRLVLIGEPTKSIAVKLALAESTVKFHLSSIYTKLKVQGRMELGAYIAENKILLK